VRSGIPRERGEGGNNDRRAEQLESRRLITEEEDTANKCDHRDECAELRGGGGWDALGGFEEEDKRRGATEDASGNCYGPDRELRWDPWITAENSNANGKDHGRGECCNQEL
jgi:hypothetical protein